MPPGQTGQIAPTVASPRASRAGHPRPDAAAITMSGAGNRGIKRCNGAIPASVATEISFSRAAPTQECDGRFLDVVQGRPCQYGRRASSAPDRATIPQADARLESCQHRLGYKVRDETTAKHRRNKQDEADHCGSVAVAEILCGGCGGSSCAASRIAMVVVLLTLSA